jgi:tRNA (cmo5U34)-methyltransferase
MGSESLPLPEEMGDFFDQRSGGYDAHMRQAVASFGAFYKAVAQPIPITQEPVRILDLGCGTGLELGPILERAPEARITAVDLSARMLAQLRSKHGARRRQILLIQGSYLEMPLARTPYDYVVSVMTLHHLQPEAKRSMYERIREAVKDGGRYIEGDYVVSEDEAGRVWAEYQEQVARMGDGRPGGYHIDLPLTMVMQRRLLLQAGFSRVDVIWAESEAAVYVAEP